MINHEDYIAIRNSLLGNKYLKILALELDYGARTSSPPTFDVKSIHIFIFRLIGYLFFATIAKAKEPYGLIRSKESFNNFIEASDNFYYMDEIPDVLVKMKNSGSV